MNQASFHFDDIASFTGPGGAIRASSFVWLDAQTLAIAFDPQSAEGDYSLVIGPEILDTSGNPMDIQYVATFTIDLTGPRVVRPTGQSQALAPFDKLTFVFDEPIAKGSFTAEDVVSFTGPGDVDLRNSVIDVEVSGARATVHFDPQRAKGRYTMTIGPQIED